MGSLLKTPRGLLRVPQRSDDVAIQRYYWDNRYFFKPWMPSYAPQRFELPFIQEWIQKTRAAQEAGSLLTFLLILDAAPDQVIGMITFSQIQRGVAQYCFLGYHIDEQYNGQGLATEALITALSYVFDILQLHRIEANIMPHNQASIRVIEKLGFEREGLCKALLKIDGRWQDHWRYALINPRV